MENSSGDTQNASEKKVKECRQFTDDGALLASQGMEQKKSALIYQQTNNDSGLNARQLQWTVVWCVRCAPEVLQEKVIRRGTSV